MIRDFLKAYFNSNSDVSSRRVNVLLFILFFMAISCIGMFTVWVKNMTVFNVVIDAVLWIIIAGIFGVSATDMWNKRKQPQPEPAPDPVEPKPEVKPEPANDIEAEITKVLKKHVPAIGQRFVPHLAKHMALANIHSDLRIAHFISQIGHESGGFKYVREIWGPTAAQRRYEGRADLGNNQLGDGKKFMGRGPLQITGRANYAEASKDMFGDDRLLNTPELLEQPEYASQSAVWFWSKRNLNQLADAGAEYKHCVAVTKRINGGTNGIKDRWAQFTKMYEQLKA